MPTGHGEARRSQLETPGQGDYAAEASAWARLLFAVSCGFLAAAVMLLLAVPR